MVMTVVACIVALIVIGIVVFEIVGWLVERKVRARFEKMTPEKRFKYQNEMRKKQLYPSASPTFDHLAYEDAMRG